jgi:hypothetical protein
LPKRTEPKLPDEILGQNISTGDDVVELDDSDDSSLPFPCISSSEDGEKDATENIVSKLPDQNLTFGRQVANNIDRLQAFAKWVEYAV